MMWCTYLFFLWMAYNDMVFAVLEPDRSSSSTLSSHLVMFDSNTMESSVKPKNDVVEQIRPTTSSQYHISLHSSGGIDVTGYYSTEEILDATISDSDEHILSSEPTTPRNAASELDFAASASANDTYVQEYTTSNLDNVTPIIDNVPSVMDNATSVMDNVTSAPVPEVPMCRCSCHYAANLKLYRNATTVNITSEEVQKELKKQVTNLQKQLSINKTNLSSEKRKKSSMVDDRASARGVGFIGVAMLVLLMGGLVLMDLTTIKRDFQRLRDNLGHCCKESDNVC